MLKYFEILVYYFKLHMPPQWTRFLNIFNNNKKLFKCGKLYNYIKFNLNNYLK